MRGRHFSANNVDQRIVQNAALRAFELLDQMAETRDPSKGPGPTSALVEFTRTGPLEADLQVLFKVSGTATNGDDYKTIPTTPMTFPDGPGKTKVWQVGKIAIPAGFENVKLRLDALDDTAGEGTEQVDLTLTLPEVGQPEYKIGSNGSKSIPIADNDPFLDPAQTVWIDRSASDPLLQELSSNYNPMVKADQVGKITLRRSIATGELAVPYSIGRRQSRREEG